jgi:hypothetical protein
MIRFASSLLALAGALFYANAAYAQTPEPEASDSSSDSAASIIVTAKSTRSATAIPQSEIQKILPGVSPLKAIQTLPGVLYITADPWGYNEQNAQIFIHGFAANQLGYTMDGIPLGDQSYGNYNGLSPQRAVISENVGRVVVSTGAGDLATASNSNLGGTVETYSSNPLEKLGIQAAQTVGSYSTSRTFVRIDSGAFGPSGENSAYIAGARQRARAWDFDGKQGGWQANAKFVHDGKIGKLTLYFDYNDMTQPNEDATVFFKPSAGGTATPVQLYTPYTKPFFYPEFDTYRTSYLTALGNSPASEGSNYRNYYSDAQRTDYLAYARFDANLSEHITWSTTGYYHHNDGAGVVAGPLGQSITTAQPYLDPAYATLPANCRFGGNGNGVRPAACTALTTAQAAAAGAALVAATGGSGLITRTTEYRIDREGIISAISADLGDHKIELGGSARRSGAAGMASTSPIQRRARPISGLSMSQPPSSPSIRARRGSTSYSSTSRTPGRCSSPCSSRPALKPARNGPMAGSRYSPGRVRSRVSPVACRRARSTRCAGSCLPWARPMTSTAMNNSISTFRRTSASIKPIWRAAAAPGSRVARRRSTPSLRRASLRAVGHMKPACARAAPSPATSGWKRRSTIITSCSTTACWRFRPTRAVSRAAASRAARRSSSTSAT